MAGAGYKLFNTGDVLTAAQVNTYLQEQTVMVFADSAARTTALSGVLAEGMMSYLQDTNAVEVYNGSAWVGVSNAGDITEVQAGVGISIASGTGPIPVITNSSTDLITTAGDILYGTAADTVARLGIGTAGQVLQVNSGATAPEWATAAGGGGETLISTTTLSGSSILLDNIPATYNDLKLIIRDYLPATDNYSLRLRFNDDANANRHRTGTDLAFGNAFNATSVNISAGNDNAVSESLVWAYIYDYTNTTTWKMNDSLSIVTDATTTANFQIWRQWGVYNQTGAISSLRLFPETGNFTSGTVLLYGVK